MKNYLVTGAAGFIGSQVVESLLNNGNRVVGVDNFDPFYDRSIKQQYLTAAVLNPAFTMLEADVTDQSLYQQHLQNYNFDCIIHVAAKAGVRPSILDPIGYQKVNVEGTQNLLEFARLKGIKQFVFASSSSVYGVNENTPWSESDHVLKPISPYASTKLSGELLGHVYSHLYGIRFIALRFFTVFGPRQRPDLAIHKFFNLMKAGREIPVFGNGSTRRDYTFVGDIVQGVLAAVNYSASNFEIINLGNRETISLLEMIDAIEKVSGLKALKKQMPLQPGDVPITFADISKARSLLGYTPATRFEDGIKAFCEWKAASGI